MPTTPMQYLRQITGKLNTSFLKLFQDKNKASLTVKFAQT